MVCHKSEETEIISSADRVYEESIEETGARGDGREESDTENTKVAGERLLQYLRKV